jgi:hypothetical protein
MRWVKTPSAAGIGGITAYPDASGVQATSKSSLTGLFFRKKVKPESVRWKSGF